MLYKIQYTILLSQMLKFAATGVHNLISSRRSTNLKIIKNIFVIVQNLQNYCTLQEMEVGFIFYAKGI